MDYLGVCGDQWNPIIFDSDGSIVDDLFGTDARNSILGFAGPECGTMVPPMITDAAALLNGRWIDGTATAKNPEISLVEFDAVIVHEFGHFVNLDHSQINLIEAFDVDASNDGAVATMFPFLVNGREALSLHLDDRVSVSMLYPEESFGSLFGEITGSILRGNRTPFQGAYVVARSVSDPRSTAVGFASGARFNPEESGGPPIATLEGSYEIPGLPPGNYTVEAEPVDPRFRSGSGVGPLDPPVDLSGLPEFYSGPDEESTNPPDDPAVAVPVPVDVGARVAGIDIILNRLVSPPNDACEAPRIVEIFPFAERTSTGEASPAGSDPIQSCTFGGPTQNSKSVWYGMTAPVAGVATAETFGSTYDTVMTAYTGACGTFSEVACNDDANGGIQSALSFHVSPGMTYWIEVAEFRGQDGGTLQFALDLTPDVCGNGVIDAGESCDDAAGNGANGCCNSLCRPQDTDGDTVCDADDVCPAVSDDQSDTDLDGVGDACDLCRTLVAGQPTWSKAKLRIYKSTDAIAGNDRTLLNGALAMAVDAFAIDPVANGAQIEIRNALGIPKLSVSLPPSPSPWGQLSQGWESFLGVFQFLDASPGGTDSVSLMHVTPGNGGRADLRLRGDGGTIAIGPEDLPLALTVVLGGAAAGDAGQCGEVNFATCRSMKTKITCDFRRK
jgi:hypothetical protein